MLPRKLVLPAIAASLLLAACASNEPRGYDPCRAMREEIKEMQDLDGRIRALTKEAASYRKQRDTAAADYADRRLRGLQENKRWLQQSLEQSSRDCSPTWQDQPPVRDPGRRIGN
jgi:hypothetical protein